MMCRLRTRKFLKTDYYRSTTKFTATGKLTWKRRSRSKTPANNKTCKTRWRTSDPNQAFIILPKRQRKIMTGHFKLEIRNNHTSQLHKKRIPMPNSLVKAWECQIITSRISFSTETGKRLASHQATQLCMLVHLWQAQMSWAIARRNRCNPNKRNWLFTVFSTRCNWMGFRVTWMTWFVSYLLCTSRRACWM